MAGQRTLPLAFRCVGESSGAGIGGRAAVALDIGSKRTAAHSMQACHSMSMTAHSKSGSYGRRVVALTATAG